MSVLLAEDVFDAIDADDYLHGAPDLVIEVLSLSNTRRELRELASLCLANGCREFWVLNQSQETVTVTTANGSTTIYRRDENISLPAFDTDEIAVSEIFGY